MELEGKARNIVRRRKDNIMMNDKQRAQVYNILLTPIKFFSEKYKESNEYPDYKIEETNIFIDKNVIKSTQSYYPYYPDSSKKRYPFSPDCDMSDFACGFYQIIYKDILNKDILNYYKLVDDDFQKTLVFAKSSNNSIGSDVRFGSYAGSQMHENNFYFYSHKTLLTSHFYNQLLIDKYDKMNK